MLKYQTNNSDICAGNSALPKSSCGMFEMYAVAMNSTKQHTQEEATCPFVASVVLPQKLQCIAHHRALPPHPHCRMRATVSPDMCVGLLLLRLSSHALSEYMLHGCRHSNFIVHGKRHGCNKGLVQGSNSTCAA